MQDVGRDRPQKIPCLDIMFSEMPNDHPLPIVVQFVCCFISGHERKNRNVEDRFWAHFIARVRLQWTLLLLE